MQSIKKIFIFSIFMIYGIECLADKALEHAGEKAAVILASAITNATQTLAPVAVDAAKGIGTEAAKALATSNVEIAKILAPTIVDAAKGIGSDVAKELADSNIEIAKVMAEVGEKGVAVVGIIGIIWASADSFVKLRPISKEIYEYYYPTEKQKTIDEAETSAAKIKLKNLKTEEKFLDCIMNTNSKTEKNTSGCPIICEEAAILFTAIAGESEVDRMVAALNKYRK